MPSERRSSESFDSFPVSSKPTPIRVHEQQQQPVPRQPFINGLSNVSDDTSMAARPDEDLSLRGYMNNNGTRMGTATAPTSTGNTEGPAHAHNNNNNNTHDDDDLPPPLSNPRRAQSNDNDHQYQRQIPLAPFGEVNLMAAPSPSSSSSSPSSPPPSASSSPQTTNNNNNRPQQTFDNAHHPFPRLALVPPKSGGVGRGTDDELSKPLISGEADDVDIYVHGEGKQVYGQQYTNDNTTTGGPPRDTPTFRYDQYRSHPQRQQQHQEGEQKHQGAVGTYGGEVTHFVGHNGGQHYDQYHQHHNEAGLSSSPTPPYRSPAETGNNAHHGTFSTSLASENAYSPPSLLPTRTAAVVSNNKAQGQGGVQIFFNNGHASNLHPFGNSRPACKGRCLCAKDFTSSVVIFVMIVTFTALFIYSWFDYGAKITISDEKMSNTSPSSPTASSTNGYEKCNGHFRAHYVPAIVQIVLAIVTVVAMLLTVATNPGVLLKQVGKNAKNHRPPPGHLDYVEVSGVQVFMPYCDTCNIVRPPRSSHCIKCNNCVDKFDHHCGIIGACIGKRNFRQFLIFLYSMIAMGLWSLLWSVFLAWVIFPTEDTVNKVFSICVAIASSLSLCVLSFMGSHYIKLISNGYTQREYLKKEKLYPAGKNPYDDGCWKNWREVSGF